MFSSYVSPSLRLAACLLAVLCAPAAIAMTVQHNVVYAERDGQALKGELYLPDGAGPHPVLVAVHGGGWKYADASFYSHWGPYLAHHGYALFAINYRLVHGKDKLYPAAPDDARAALGFVRRQAAALHLDDNRLGLIGDSAGAQIAALAALTDEGKPRLKALVGIYGIYDMAAQWQDDHAHRPDDDIVGDYLGTTPQQAPALYADASPLMQIHAGAGSPAVLLVWGTRDDRVDSKAQSKAFLKALQDKGYAAQALVMQGAPHYWASDPIKPGKNYPGYLAPRLLHFLEQSL